MIRKALLLCAGLVAAACFACAQTPPPPPPPDGSAVTAIWPLTVCNAGNFAANVTILNAGFDPTANPYVPPNGGTRPGWIIQQDLQDAFSNAPPVVQNHLCALSGVFINPSSCSTAPCNAGGLFANSWGFRSQRGTDKGKTYIAIPGELWPSSSHAVAFSAYENAILQYLIAKMGAPGWTNSSSRPSISSSTPANQPWLTVLAALAHELGHVQWVLDTLKNPGDDYDFTTLQNCPTDSAVGTPIDFFQGWDYQRKKQLEPPKRWRMFADRLNNENRTTLHAYLPQLGDFTDPFSNPNQLFFQLYRGDQSGNYQSWASLFAAETPDEDFVETYVLYALLGNRFDNSNYNGPYLASLPVSIPGYTGAGFPTQWADIPLDLLAGRKLILAAKMRCLERLQPLSHSRGRSN